MARHDISTRDVLDIVEIAIGGKVATIDYEGNRYFNLVVKFLEEFRSSAEKIKNLLLRTALGALIALMEWHAWS